MTLHDSFGRQITDLRVSVTDRCNFRCVYCRSADPENYRDHDEILSWPELDRLAGIFLDLGIRKVRVTGGEPLVREGVENYISRLHARGFPYLSMTTNGHLLAERCDRLLAAGLRRINISMDSLKPDRFQAITKRGSLDEVLNGTFAAKKATKVMRGKHRDRRTTENVGNHQRDVGGTADSPGPSPLLGSGLPDPDRSTTRSRPTHPSLQSKSDRHRADPYERCAYVE